MNVLCWIVAGGVAGRWMTSSDEQFWNIVPEASSTVFADRMSTYAKDGHWAKMESPMNSATFGKDTYFSDVHPQKALAYRTRTEVDEMFERAVHPLNAMFLIS